MTRTHVSLFAGIGASDIAAEHLGYTTTHCVEIDTWNRALLTARFPHAEVLEDVRTVGARELGVGMDLVSGGFPCQDLSSAGKGGGLAAARSGLWFEFLRIIGECRPKQVLIENVAVLKSRGLNIVVKGLAEKGYGCWWDCVPALGVGAPHLRDRIWITAAPFAQMPPVNTFDLPPTGPWLRRVGPDDPKLPRAGYATVRGHQTCIYELEPRATIKAAKLAVGAEKREGGVTWLTKLDSPLFPTPSASSYGSNRGGAAGRVGPVRHSLTSMARSGDWPAPLFPTPTVADSRNSRNATAGRKPGSAGHSGTTLCDFTRLWPTPHGMSNPAAPRAAGPSGNELGNAVNVEARLWPTATAHPRTHTPRPVHHGRQLANEVALAARLWPTATARCAEGRAAQASRYGPGQRRSNLDDAVAHTAKGALNPDWAEWLMGLPIGWTDPGCAAPVQRDWLSEHDIPRTATNVPHRKQRLMACGNAQVWQVAYQRLALADRLLGSA